MTTGAEAVPVFRRAPDVADVVDTAARGHAVLLHLPSGRRTVLSETATAVWRALAEAGSAGVSIEVLAPPLAAQFGADPVVVARDVERLLGDLVFAGLVENVPSGGVTRSDESSR